jgi:hypothetical protein
MSLTPAYPISPSTLSKLPDHNPSPCKFPAHLYVCFWAWALSIQDTGLMNVQKTVGEPLYSKESDGLEGTWLHTFWKVENMSNCLWFLKEIRTPGQAKRAQKSAWVGNKCESSFRLKHIHLAAAHCQ